MDAIKKKMQAMKSEKENALDKADQLDQQLKDMEQKSNKQEEELTNFQKRVTQLENELDQAQEQLSEANNQLETKEKRLTDDSESEGNMDDEEGTIPIKPHLNTAQECRDINNDGTSAARCACGDLSKQTESSAINKTQSKESINSEQDIKVKKKKKKKKSDKYEGMTKEEKTEYKERRRKRRQDKEIKKLAKSSNNDSKTHLDIRPEPEGGAFCPTTELDKIVHNNDPLFSDIEDFPDEPEKPQRSRRRGFVPCLQLGVNSNTIIKFTIIGTEVQNVYANLRRVRTA